MKKNRISLIIGTALIAVFVVSGFTQRKNSCNKTEAKQIESKQKVNMFVSHGHCSLPFSGTVENLKVDLTKRDDLGNPLEDMRISFDIDPQSFAVCRGEDLTSRVKTPGLFIDEDDNQITFRTSEVYTMGIDWYQINGVLSIKGVEQKVKLFATGVRDPKSSKASSIVLEGQFNLMDWGIDYDKIVNGKSDPTPTKWMHLNMRFGIC